MLPFYSKTALALSLLGALLDFASGTYLLQAPSSSMMDSTGMMPLGDGRVLWAVLLYGLGSLLVVTGVLGVTRVGVGRMATFGVMMVVYGVVMLILAGVMLTGATPMMQAALVLSLGMLLVGLGMTANGVLMATRRKMTK